ncbi:hypothetical protein BDV29DRAFT_190458 [Aspergillus leporis]|jgi:hypothetical protein|uniref:Uncharacterized protein n=1 Tax=Aspergillus leporis TaxID=41062 RepID=A0A5N5X701_9EURO|nr:hypothetical protein BDV29DRAFT_190458 [Aspergillus leporis]
MIFSKVFLSAALALTASALPHLYNPTYTATATITIGGTSTPTPTPTPSSSGTPTPTPTGGSSSGSGVHIKNNYNTPVYLWSVSETFNKKHTIAAGETYHEDWQSTAKGGVSIKLATTDSPESVLQFEYTAQAETLWWDLSSINLAKTSEFIKSGFSAIPGDSSCSSATCIAGDVLCIASYQNPDDIATRSCTSKSGITLNLG